MSAKRSLPKLVPHAQLAEGEPLDDRETAAALMCAELEARGVAHAVAQRVAAELAVSFAALPPDAYERALAGVVAACEASGTEEGAAHAPEPRTAQVRETARRLRELQHLMSGFLGELAKLDEALEVLAAYLRRMRQSAKAGPASPGGQVLH
jgi:hypothetical protein